MVIIAKLSDIFGRKPFTMVVLIIFIAFSLGCGLTHSMTSLYVGGSILLTVTDRYQHNIPSLPGNRRGWTILDGICGSSGDGSD